MGTADALALSSADGLLPDAVLPHLRPQPPRPGRRGRGVRASRWANFVVNRLQSPGSSAFACEDPDAPENWPRVLTLWRANLFGSSGKGNEYFLKHLLGTESSVRAEGDPARETAAARHRVARRGARRASSTCWCTLDFRMTSSTILSDIVLPAATWYEKHDISPPPTCTPSSTRSTRRSRRPGRPRRTGRSSSPWPRRSSPLGAKHLGVRKDLVAVPLLHDTPEAMATPPRRGPGLAGRESANRCRGRRCRSWSSSSATTVRSRRS